MPSHVKWNEPQLDHIQIVEYKYAHFASRKSPEDNEGKAAMIKERLLVLTEKSVKMQCFWITKYAALYDKDIRRDIL